MQFRYPSAQTVLLAVAGSSSAQIQPMIPQYPNSSYTTPFFGPAIQCENANSSTAQKINNMYSATVPPYSDSQGRPYTSYYGFVPGRSQNGTLTSVDLAHLPDTYSEINNAKIPSAPEIWIRTHVSEPPDGDITLAYGLKDDPNIPWDVNPGLFASQAVWMALAQLLTGHFQDSPFTTRLFQTPVIGSQEFIPYFVVDTGDRVQPFARNQTVPEVIEELSRNVTVSLSSSESHLSPTMAQADLTIYDLGNVYHFNQKVLLLSYGIALLATVVSVAIGLLAYSKNGGSRDLVYSALLKAAQESEDSVPLQGLSRSSEVAPSQPYMRPQWG